MNLEKWLKKTLFIGIARFLPLALLASATDAGVLWGVRSFMQILSQDTPFTIGEWIAMMIALAALRFFSLFWKTKVSETFLFNTCAQTTTWFLRTLRELSPRLFHNGEGDALVETAYESTQVLQNNGSVFFQAVQAALQLVIFFPVLLYISWPLTLFLFAIVVPVVALMQRKLHAMGPEEETLLYLRSKFRTDLNQTRRLYRKWSASFERSAVTNQLQASLKELNHRGLSASIRKNGLSLATETISILSMILVLAFCALLISRGWMDGTGLVLFCSAVLLSYKPVKECARVMPQFRAAMSAFRLLQKFGAQPKKKYATGTPVKRATAESNAQEASGKEDPASDRGESLQIHDGHFGYAFAENDVYTCFNMTFSEEKPVLLRGRNGSGKSTLLRLLAGLEEWESGTTRHLTKARNAGIFFVSQELELPPRELFLALLHRNANAAIGQFIETAGVLHLLDKEGLSGGERARIALTWALVSKSAVLLLDEPFAAVALVDREPLLNSFLDCAQTLNKWVMIASHDAMSDKLLARFNVMELNHA